MAERISVTPDLWSLLKPVFITLWMTLRIWWQVNISKKFSVEDLMAALEAAGYEMSTEENQRVYRMGTTTFTIQFED